MGAPLLPPPGLKGRCGKEPGRVQGACQGLSLYNQNPSAEMPLAQGWSRRPQGFLGVSYIFL